MKRIVLITVVLWLGGQAGMAAMEATGTVVNPPPAVVTNGDLSQGLARVLAFEASADFVGAIQLVKTLQAQYANQPGVGKLAEVLPRLKSRKRKAVQLSFAMEKIGSDNPIEVQAANQQLAEEPEVAALLLRRSVRKDSGKVLLGAINVLSGYVDADSALALLDRLEAEPAGPLADALVQAFLREVDGLTEQPELDRRVLADNLERLFRKVAADTGFARTDLAGLLLRVVERWFGSQATPFDEFLKKPGAYEGLAGFVGRAASSSNSELQAWAYWGLGDLGKENTSGLIGWWKFDETEGSVAKDFPPSKLNGFLTGGVTRCAGRIKGGLRFDGVSAEVVNGWNLFPAVTNTFTMALWVSPTMSLQPVLESREGAAGCSGQRYAIYPSHGTAYGDQQAGAGISVGDNGVNVMEHAAGYLPPLLVYQEAINGWTHIAVVYENQQPRLYVNGKLVRKGLVSTMTVHPSAGLGCSAGGYGCFAGMLDDLRIYNRALSDNEVMALAKSAGGVMPVVRK